MNMKNLPNCTLIAIDCVQPTLAVKALQKTCEQIKFKEVLLFSDNKPHNLPENYKFIQIDKINNLDEYSHFVIYELPNYINTDFCFSVHWDGFVINPHLWDDKYMEYDYIGAPWVRTAHFLYKNERVGNGGVSIRSKRLMDYVKTLNCSGHEDTAICSNHRQHLIEKGFKFAPLELASNFSVECVCDDINVNFEKVFAFHGKHTNNHVEKIKQNIAQYYCDDLIQMDLPTLENWIRNEAGSQQPDCFYCNTSGNLQLQQIPEEYSKFLNFIKDKKINSYLELGVGNGGSFLISSIFLQKTATRLHCVDSIAERDSHVKQTEEKIMSKINILKRLFTSKDIQFFNSTTDTFFTRNNTMYDCIFIDADHTYDGVKNDYINAIKFINKGGYIIFHDIANKGTGVNELWEEIKNEYLYTEFKHKYNEVDFYNCGIGIIQLPQ